MGKALDNARRIYLEGIAGGNAREAVHKYTSHRYTQHSTGVGVQRDSLPSSNPLSNATSSAIPRSST